MLRVKKQVIKIKDILKECNKNAKNKNSFYATIKLVDDRVLIVKQETDKSYTVYIVYAFGEIYRGVAYTTKSYNIKHGIQKALLDCKYKVAVI